MEELSACSDTLRIAYVLPQLLKVKPKLETRPFPYWLADEPDALNVSGGSKKHWCQSAASDNVVAFHCRSAGNVAAILPPSTESKISPIPARSCGFCASSA